MKKYEKICVEFTQKLTKITDGLNLGNQCNHNTDFIGVTWIFNLDKVGRKHGECTMNKISKEELLDFRTDITSILSPERLKSFDGNTKLL